MEGNVLYGFLGRVMIKHSFGAGKRVFGLPVFCTGAALVPLHAFGLTITDLTTTLTAEDLANTVIGPGITISNVSYTGAAGAAGTFSGGSDNDIGIESGILLSSGLVLEADGPNDFDDNTTQFSTPGDEDLDSLVIVSTGSFDAAVLEFDFVSTGPVVVFRYVFGSDEYNEYANGGFNDVFGFFINDVNVALIPDTDIPVSIGTVNGGDPLTCTNGEDDDLDTFIDGNDPDCDPGDNIVGEDSENAEFYIDNDCRTTFPGEPAVSSSCSLNIEADGLTVVLTITAIVNPGTNHIKLAIQDVMIENLTHGSSSKPRALYRPTIPGSMPKK